MQVVLPGEVQGSKEAMLAAALGGYVEKVYVEEGAEVRQGAMLAAVDRAIAEVRLEQATAQRDQAKNDLAIVERAGKSLPKARRDAARFGAIQAESAFKLAEISRRRASVRAPFGGAIAKLVVEQGEVLPPGGPVARLVKLDPIHVSLSVSDVDVTNLKVGMSAKVSSGASPTVFEGKIQRISPAADLDTRTFEVIVLLPNKERALRPGMIATVRLEVEAQGDSIAIPQDVLVTRRRGNGVFVVENGHAKWRSVKLGSIVQGQFIVKEGLQPGAMIVVRGHRELEDNDSVIVAREGACCTNGKIVFPTSKSAEVPGAP